MPLTYLQLISRSRYISFANLSRPDPRLRPDPPSPSRSDVSVQIRRLRPDPRSRRDRDSKPQNVESSARITTFSDTHERSVCSSLYESHNPAITHLLRSTMIDESVSFSSDKRYATTQGVVRVLTVSHGFVYEPYALHEKISWWRRCLYVTYWSLRSLYSTQELAGVSMAILNFLQRI
ncbi:hypothetical protein F2Q69_00011897 [Brassica cretica]|uniref:Uncharacterized protein n=1 Tax=Brassica cretica TaxID=69181 RepID=A0A8S9QR86_BRACR|nr:hypothetical protein F2Q69_00011897 [Brassica cretica]